MKLTIKLVSLKVTDNGDPSHETNGELYYSFKVNGKSLCTRSRSNPKSVRDGATIRLNDTKVVEITGKSRVSLSGYVGDADKGFNGKDEYDDFSLSIRSSNNWKQGAHSVHLIDGRLNTTLNYEVTLTDAAGDVENLITPKKSASVTIVSFEDSKFYNLIQNAHNKYSHGFEGYNKSVLIKKTFAEAKKPTVHIKDTSKETIFKTLRDLADDGYYIDLIIHSHGTYERIPMKDNVTITNSDINGLDTGRYAGGRFPLRMVYQINCNGSTLNNNFIAAGAKAVCGARFINFYPNQCNKFLREWNSGERFDTSLNNSDTASARTVMQSLIVLDSKTTSFSPKCKLFTTVLGSGDCSEAYFNKVWLSASRNEYRSSMSGKENMNFSSKMIIMGDPGLRKADRLSW